VLKTLDQGARALVTDAFLFEGAQVDFKKHEQDFPRLIRLGALEAVLKHAATEFEDPPEADKWLGPRVHAALRLTRREAADRGLWSYLGLVPFQKYVRWRFAKAPATRFVGAPHDHMLGRLWWGGELLRNGSDYGDVVNGFKIQDIPNSFRFDIFHRRPLAIAVVRVLETWRKGEPATGRQANRLLQAMNMELVTLALDADIADAGAVGDETWLTTEPEAETLLDEKLPVGPDDAPVGDEVLAEATALVRSIAEDIKLEQ
jgi:Family of unknown function (DUF6339)